MSSGIENSIESTTTTNAPVETTVNVDTSGVNNDDEQISTNRTQGLIDKIDLSETIGGSQTRRYLNKNVTPFLLNGMRQIAIDKPDDPLRVLGEYLIQQSDIINKERK